MWWLYRFLDDEIQSKSVADSPVLPAVDQLHACMGSNEFAVLA
jgi:hypothetical protein